MDSISNTTSKTPTQLAAEINIIKEQTARQVLSASIEIGERLEQAKALVEHGEWEAWLRDNVSYSHSTAQNLMRIAREYGSKQIDLTAGCRAPADLYAKLTYSQAVALFALPEADRVDFIDNNDVESMSTRELRAAISAEKAARTAAEQAQFESEQASEQLRESVARLKTEVEEVTNAAAKAERNAHSDRQRAAASEAARAALEEQIAELRTAPPQLTEEQIAEIERRIEEKYSAQISQLTLDIETAQRREKEIEYERARLERKIKQEADSELVRFQTLFERLQIDISALLEIADKVGGQRAIKLRQVIADVVGNILS